MAQIVANRYFERHCRFDAGRCELQRNVEPDASIGLANAVDGATVEAERSRRGCGAAVRAVDRDVNGGGLRASEDVARHFREEASWCSLANAFRAEETARPAAAVQIRPAVTARVREATREQDRESYAGTTGGRLHHHSATANAPSTTAPATMARPAIDSRLARPYRPPSVAVRSPDA